MTRLAAATFSMGLVVLNLGVVCGQTASTGSGQAYPNKPIRIMTSPAGGSGDFMARLVAQGITGSLGQPVIVENRALITARDSVAKAPPDGYTLLFSNSSLWIQPLLQKVSYDPVKDFSPITMTGESPNVMVVHLSLPVKSVKELIAYAKAKPRELSYGSAGAGTSGHIGAELFASMTGVNMVHIPYKGAGPAMIALLSNEVQLNLASAISVAPHLKSGKLRALAVTSVQPSALVPDVPTVGATVPGYVSTTIYGIWAPDRTPARFITRLNQEIVRMLKTPEAKERLLSTGVEAAPSSPEQFAAIIQSDMSRMGKVIKDAGIRTE